jgi:MerR family transcriptional regulator/heat shock protein HspR
MRAEHDLYFISMAARLLDMHPQSLRNYERLGLVQQKLTIGRMRVSTREQLDRLRLIKKLVDDEGVNLAGVQRLLEIAESLQRIRPLMNGDAGSREARRRLLQELDRMAEMVGL